MRCRTCFDIIADGQGRSRSLDEVGCSDTNKTFAEILFEIAKIDTKVESTSEFQQLCDLCAERVKSAYNFILTAQKVNERLVNLSKNEEKSILDESPIDIPYISTWEIKSEIGNLNFEFDDTEIPMCEPNIEINTDTTWQSNVDTLINCNEQKVKEEISNERDLCQLEKPKEAECSDENNDDSKEVDSAEEETGRKTILKKKRGRPRKLSNETSTRENVCDVCGKSFIWHKDLIRHSKKHFLKPELKCDYCERLFLRKDKLNDHIKTHCRHMSRANHLKPLRLTEWNFAKRLYEDQKISSIQCKLCEQEFKRITDLRRHLLVHEDYTTIKKCPQITSTKELNQSEEELKLKISKNITEKIFSEYYAIVNSYGYELCLSDSDETDEDENACTKYVCILCEERFNRKHKIFSHTLEVHLNEQQLPLKCTVCKMEFVSGEMLRQHEKRQCRNKARKYQCTRCPGKFMWAENSENHQCANRHNTQEHRETVTRSRKRNAISEDTTNISKTINKLQCDHCDKTFIWPKDLTRHMRLHVPDREKFTCTICDKKFNRKDNLQVHLKVHNDEERVECRKKETSSLKPAKVHAVDDALTKPHGCKVIECKLCLSKQMRLADLKAHLSKHQNETEYVDRWDTAEKVGELLYPELGKSLDKVTLLKRIATDLSGQHYQRFYSITDEVGYEMDLNSSETETDSDQDEERTQDCVKVKQPLTKYNCEICDDAFERKYQIFAHQAQQHKWNEALNSCNHCGARFVSKKLLSWHYDRQCRNNLKRFLCKKCPLRFMWKQNLEVHMRTVHKLNDEKGSPKTNTFRCTQCNRMFQMQKDLTRHLLMQTCRFEHGEHLKCLFCARRFYRNENLAAHMLRHGVPSQSLTNAEFIVKASSKPNGIKQINCRICNVTFNSIGALRTHLLKETNDALTTHYNFESLHNYSITNNLGFEIQMEDSETENENENGTEIGAENGLTPKKSPYQCIMCNLYAKRKYQIMQHQLSMHKYEELPFKCERCIFRTVSKDILTHHMSTQCYNQDKKFQCEICKFNFMWPENLEVHQRLHHTAGTSGTSGGVSTDNGADGNAKQIYQCDQCVCRYNRKDRLNAHIKKVHQAGSSGNEDLTKFRPNVNVEPKKDAMEKKFLCAFCGRSLTSSSNLIIHMRRHTGEKPFKCEFCDMAFPRSSDLLAHRRKHTGERPHPCTICEKAFSRSYKLMLHMRTHTGERPHKCTYCEKSFSQSNDLTLHIRRHTGERPYVCGVCGERFIQGTALKNHRTMRGHYDTEDATINVQVP